MQESGLAKQRISPPIRLSDRSGSRSRPPFLSIQRVLAKFRSSSRTKAITRPASTPLASAHCDLTLVITRLPSRERDHASEIPYSFPSRRAEPIINER